MKPYKIMTGFFITITILTTGCSKNTDYVIQTGNTVSITENMIVVSDNTVTFRNRDLSNIKITIPSVRDLTVSVTEIRKVGIADLNPITSIFSIDTQESYRVYIQLPDSKNDIYVIYSYDQDTDEIEGIPHAVFEQNQAEFTCNGNVSFFIGKIKRSTLDKRENVFTKFLPGEDDYNMSVLSSYYTPEGNSVGISLSALWHFRYINNGKIHTEYTYPEDYIRVSSIQYDQRDYINSSISTQTFDAFNQWNYIKTSMMITNRPQLVVLRRGLETLGVIAYKVERNYIYIADPRYPKSQGRYLQYNHDENRFYDYDGYNEIFWLGEFFLTDKQLMKKRALEEYTYYNDVFMPVQLIFPYSGTIYSKGLKFNAFTEKESARNLYITVHIPSENFYIKDNTPIFTYEKGFKDFVFEDILKDGYNVVEFYVTDEKDNIFSYQRREFFVHTGLMLVSDKEKYAPGEKASIKAEISGGALIPHLKWYEENTGTLIAEGVSINYIIPSDFIGTLVITAENKELDIKLEIELISSIDFEDMKLTRVETEYEIYFVDSHDNKQGLYQHFYDQEKTKPELIFPFS